MSLLEDAKCVRNTEKCACEWPANTDNGHGISIQSYKMKFASFILFIIVFRSIYLNSFYRKLIFYSRSCDP